MARVDLALNNKMERVSIHGKKVCSLLHLIRMAKTVLYFLKDFCSARMKSITKPNGLHCAVCFGVGFYGCLL